MADQTVRSVRSGGIGILGLLTVLFVGLKLAGVGKVAAWSWWWVLAPLWAPWALFMVFLLFAFVGMMIAEGKK